MSGTLPRRGILFPGLPQDTAPPRPTIIPRTEWAAGLPPKRPVKTETPRFLLVHHSAGANGVTSRTKVIKTLRGYYKMHTTTKKWPDLAYNFVIDAKGRIWEGRAGSLDGPVRGDATGGNQGFDQKICLLGNFQKRQPTKAAYSSLVKLLAWLAVEYDIDVAKGKSITFTSRGSNRWKKGKKVKTYPIGGHRDMSLTACPGDAFHPRIRKKVLPDVRARVAEYRQTRQLVATNSPAARSTQVPIRLATLPGGVVGGGLLGVLGWVIQRRNLLAAGSALVTDPDQPCPPAAT